MSDVTRILSAIESGDPSAAEKLLPLVYDELRKLAAAKLANEKAGQTLQATALVHEAYLRLVEVDQRSQWNSRRHFFAAAAEAMRRILVERARRKDRQKHGGDWNRISLGGIEAADNSRDIDLLILDEALDCLAEDEPVACELVKLRFFVGLSIEHAAEALGISLRTANRNWAYAKAWLFQALHS